MGQLTKQEARPWLLLAHEQPPMETGAIPREKFAGQPSCTHASEHVVDGLRHKTLRYPKPWTVVVNAGR